MSDAKKTIGIVVILALIFGVSYAGEDILALFEKSETAPTETAPVSETTSTKPTPNSKNQKLPPAIQIPIPQDKATAPAPATQLPSNAISDPYGKYKAGVKDESLKDTLSSIQGSEIDEEKREQQNQYFKALVEKMHETRSANSEMSNSLPNQNPERKPLVFPGISLNPPSDVAPPTQLPASPEQTEDISTAEDEENLEPQLDESTDGRFINDPGSMQEEDYSGEEEEVFQGTLQEEQYLPEEQEIVDEYLLEEN